MPVVQRQAALLLGDLSQLQAPARLIYPVRGVPESPPSHPIPEDDIPHARLEDRRVYRRKYRAANQERLTAITRKSRLKTQYGLTVEDFDALLAAQGGRCAICTAEAPLHVDHCHATGAVRGLLCTRCNKAIGVLGDTADSVLRAVTYLREAECTT